MKTNQLKTIMLALLVATASLVTVNAQTLTVKGKVTDVTDGSNIVGCTVQVEGTTRGTITNVNGEYCLSRMRGNSHVRFLEEKASVRRLTHSAVSA